MEQCREIEPQLAAYVDGETDAAGRTAVEAHLEACAACRGRVESERRAHELLCARRAALRGCAPELLRRRCEAQRARADAADRSWARRAALPLAAAAALVLAAAVGFTFGRGDAVERYGAQLAADHLKCFQFPPSGAADTTIIGQAWQQANGWPVRVAASSDAERLELLGLRRCGSTRGRVAHALYRWRGEPVSVYVLNGTVDREPGHDHAVERLGERAIIWADRGRTYAVVAGRQMPELERVAAFFRRTIE